MQGRRRYGINLAFNPGLDNNLLRDLAALSREKDLIGIDTLEEDSNLKDDSEPSLKKTNETLWNSLLSDDNKLNI